MNQPFTSQHRSIFARVLSDETGHPQQLKDFPTNEINGCISHYSYNSQSLHCVKMYFDYQ